MVSSSYDTTRITTIRSRSNFAHVKEQKHECNNPFFDRKIENASEGLKLECYKQFYKNITGECFNYCRLYLINEV
jgi:hypothetical protein